MKKNQIKIAIACGVAGVVLSILFPLRHTKPEPKPEQVLQTNLVEVRPQATQAPDGPPYPVHAEFTITMGDSSKRVYQRPVQVTQTNNNTNL